MLIFHNKRISHLKFPDVKSFKISNLVQIKVYEIIQNIFKKDNALEVISCFKKLSLGTEQISTILNSPKEISFLHTLIMLKNERGASFLTHKQELTTLSKGDEYTTNLVIQLLETLKVISISESLIFRIEFLYDKELCESSKVFKVRQRRVLKESVKGL